ncbi:MAG: hypothetical protein MN733_07340 [Nitrososphaera sp.]|nr:hypothetical protein [Nitrososphaera sp.]
MRALKIISGVVTFAALSLSGPSAWAGDSFVVEARLTGGKVVPSVLSTVKGDLCLIISEPQTTSTQTIGQTVAQQVRRRPGVIIIAPGNLLGSDVVKNIRMYFGQRFANGQPIITLCDDDFKKEGCFIPEGGDEVCANESVLDEPPAPCEPLDFDLNSVQFQSEQIGLTENQVDPTGRLFDVPCPGDIDSECGFLVIKDLIKRGLIYVVVNSDFKAKKRKDGTVRYRPPKERLAVDGDLRGTLSSVDECPP